MDQAQVVVHSTRMAVQVLLRLRLLPCSVRARMRVRMLCISLVIDARNWVHDFGTQIVDKINQTNHRSSSAISFIALSHTPHHHHHGTHWRYMRCVWCSELWRHPIQMPRLFQLRSVRGLRIAWSYVQPTSRYTSDATDSTARLVRLYAQAVAAASYCRSRC
jgi:hypothetical protein